MKGSLFGIDAEPTYSLWDPTKPTKPITLEDLQHAVELAKREPDPAFVHWEQLVCDTYDTDRT